MCKSFWEKISVKMVAIKKKSFVDESGTNNVGNLIKRPLSYSVVGTVLLPRKPTTRPGGPGYTLFVS